jgi:hypothetical protein
VQREVSGCSAFVGHNILGDAACADTLQVE